MRALAKWGFHQLPISMLRRLLIADQARVRPLIHELFFTDLLETTKNFGDTTWMGRPIWQNVLDLQTIQETIVALKPDLLMECGTNRGGSAFFFGQLFDLLGHGHVVSVDVEKMHDLTHPRVTYLIGSSVSDEIVKHMAEMAAQAKTVMVILDSDHSAAHVAQELERYHGFVTPGSFLLVQDGVIDTLPMFEVGRPGPLPAIQAFLAQHPEFEVDHARINRFLITHHPFGWLRRVR